LAYICGRNIILDRQKLINQENLCILQSIKQNACLNLAKPLLTPTRPGALSASANRAQAEILSADECASTQYYIEYNQHVTKKQRHSHHPKKSVPQGCHILKRHKNPVIQP